jgi:hypothetical protein
MKVLSSSGKGVGEPTGMRIRNPLFTPRFTVTSKVARTWIVNAAEEVGSLLATVGVVHLLALCNRAIRSCIVAISGVASALAALAAEYLAVEAAGAASGSITEFELSPRSSWRRLGVGGGAVVPERTQVYEE